MSSLFMDKHLKQQPPIIDLTPFVAAAAAAADEDDDEIKRAARDATAKALLEAATLFGAFHVIGHGISPEDLQTAYAAADTFFALPITAKESASRVPNQGGFTRGYIGIGAESGSDALEVKEALSYGCDWDPARPPENPMQGPNRFPDALDVDARRDLLRFYDQAVGVARAITECVAWALDMPELVSACVGGETISLMRVFRYLPYTEAATATFEPDADRIGSSPHTDWGFLTLIASQKPGLQLAMKKGHHPDTTEWLTIDPVPNALIVNAGDYLALITAGRLVSPLHRVVTTTEERTSFVFFWYPAYDSRISADSILHTEVESEDGGGGGSSFLSNLSLLKDQNAGRGADVVSTDGGVLERSKNTLDVLMSGSFGDYILGKWASVARRY